jgi:hypothetical protein
LKKNLIGMTRNRKQLLTGRNSKLRDISRLNALQKWLYL